MVQPQKTKFQVNVIENLQSLNDWADNPWRRYSLALIIFFLGYFLGSSLGMMSAVFELMDPIAAFTSVLGIEVLIKLRREIKSDKTKRMVLLLIDFLRYGLYYGFFTEALKLL